MAPAIIAAIISAAASKVKSNQSNAMKMNEGNKTGGSYQISGENNNAGNDTSYQPTSQSTNTVGTGGGDLAKNIVKQYLEKKASEGTSEVAEAASEAATETVENVTNNIH